MTLNKILETIAQLFFFIVSGVFVIIFVVEVSKKIEAYKLKRNKQENLK
jgi:hypothetical protein